MFSIIWTIIGAFYYYVLASYIMQALEWFVNHLAFSYILGLFSGFILIDTIYSSRIYLKIRKYAKENSITIKYEQLKMYIKDVQLRTKEKYSFLNPFKQTHELVDYLLDYKNKIINKLNRLDK